MTDMTTVQSVTDNLHKEDRPLKVLHLGMFTEGRLVEGKSVRQGKSSKNGQVVYNYYILCVKTFLNQTQHRNDLTWSETVLHFSDKVLFIFLIQRPK